MSVAWMRCLRAASCRDVAVFRANVAEITRLDRERIAMATPDRWLLPDGIEDVLPAEAARIEAARRQVLDLFHSWGYELVITPHVEYLESLLTAAGPDLDLRTLKVTDPLSGRQMGFRADITPQVARLDAHSHGKEGPSRLCYAGSVLHARPRPLSTSRCPIQIGAEFYGDSSVVSDGEVINLMLEVLKLAGIPDLHMDLGHVGIYRGLVSEACLDAEAERLLFDALQRKAIDELPALTAGLPAELATMIRALPTLCGGSEVLAQARAVLAEAPEDVLAELSVLEQLAAGLQARHPELSLYFDLAELRGYHYHTGVVFAAFVPGVGEAIAQGGRYDDIGAGFGRARPATGFSTDLQTLVRLGDAIQAAPAAGVWAPRDADPQLWVAMQALRSSGRRVIQALPGQSVADARAAGCDAELRNEDGWHVVALAD